jgi:hypothetical protein
MNLPRDNLSLEAIGKNVIFSGRGRGVSEHSSATAQIKSMGRLIWEPRSVFSKSRIVDYIRIEFCSHPQSPVTTRTKFRKLPVPEPDILNMLHSS